MRGSRSIARLVSVVAVALCTALSGCGLLSNHFLASSGPLRADVKADDHGRIQSIRLIDVDSDVTQRLLASESHAPL
jgi:hypothetical protein